MQTIDFGWLPEGLDRRTVSVRSSVQTLVASHPVSSQAGADMVDKGVRLVAHPPGWQPSPPGAPPRTGDLRECRQGKPAPPVNGHHAYYLAGRTGSYGGICIGVMWEYAERTWAEVSADGFGESFPPDQDPALGNPAGAARLRQIAHQVAEGARVEGVRRAVRLPFRLASAPAGLELAESVTTVGGQGEAINSGTMVFTNPRNHKDVYLSCEATEQSWQQLGQGSPTTVLGGHPAIVTQGTVDVFGVGGCWVHVGSANPGSSGAVHGEELIDLYRSVQPVARPADVSTWTDRPLG